MDLVLALLSALFGNLNPTVSATQRMSTKYHPAGGDTTFYTAWVPTFSGCPNGNFRGGCVYGLFNDGQWTNSEPQHSIGLIELVSYEHSQIANTVLYEKNAFTSYTFGTYCPDGVNYYYTGSIWSLGTDIYINLICQNRSNNFQAVHSGILKSPDGGIHWCNYRTYLDHMGAPGCDKSNWDPDGDLPRDLTAFQWPSRSADDYTKRWSTCM
jgi:hypothetical protein